MLWKPVIARPAGRSAGSAGPHRPARRRLRRPVDHLARRSRARLIWRHARRARRSRAAGTSVAEQHEHERPGRQQPARRPRAPAVSASSRPTNAAGDDDHHRRGLDQVARHRRPAVVGEGDLDDHPQHAPARRGRASSASRRTAASSTPEQPPRAASAARTGCASAEHADDLVAVDHRLLVERQVAGLSQLLEVSAGIDEPERRDEHEPEPPPSGRAAGTAQPQPRGVEPGERPRLRTAERSASTSTANASRGPPAAGGRRSPPAAASTLS